MPRIPFYRRHARVRDPDLKSRDQWVVDRYWSNHLDVAGTKVRKESKARLIRLFVCSIAHNHNFQYGTSSLFVVPRLLGIYPPAVQVPQWNSRHSGAREPWTQDARAKEPVAHIISRTVSHCFRMEDRVVMVTSRVAQLNLPNGIMGIRATIGIHLYGSSAGSR